MFGFVHLYSGQEAVSSGESAGNFCSWGNSGVVTQQGIRDSGAWELFSTGFGVYQVLQPAC